VSFGHFAALFGANWSYPRCDVRFKPSARPLQSKIAGRAALGGGLRFVCLEGTLAEQAFELGKALVRGTADGGRIISTIFKDKIKEMV